MRKFTRINESNYESQVETVQDILDSSSDDRQDLVISKYEIDKLGYFSLIFTTCGENLYLEDTSFEDSNGKIIKDSIAFEISLICESKNAFTWIDFNDRNHFQSEKFISDVWFITSLLKRLEVLGFKCFLRITSHKNQSGIVGVIIIPKN